MASVELLQVGKRYPNGFEAVRAVDLTIADGEFVVLVGPSGCGKTTTLRMIAGLEDATSGELRIGGRRVNELPPKARDVAMVFQSYALYPHMTVYENMAFGLKLRRMPPGEIRERVEQAARMLGITELLPRKPKQMSGGQRQRVAMGRAIVRRPAVFLFDEPLSNLDAALRLQMRVELGELHRRLKATSVYVTHDQVEAMTLADRIVLMRAGEVQQVGPPLELFSRPANLFVATFIGSPAMNILPVQIAGERVVGDGFDVPAPAHRPPPGEARMGIRPQHVRLDGDAPDAVGAAVLVVEPMGSESYVHCRVGAARVVARAEGVPPLRPGDAVRLRFGAERMHFFGAASEKRL